MQSIQYRRANHYTQMVICKTMVGDPTLSAASLTLSSIMKIFGQYQAYQSSKIRDTDKGLREEIGRRLLMITKHLDVLENRFLRAKNTDAIDALQHIRTISLDFRNEIVFGITGSSDDTSVVKVLKKPQIKALMEHDLGVLKRLVESTHLINALVDASDVSTPMYKKSLQEFEQKLTGVRNRYSDRVSFLSGLQ